MRSRPKKPFAEKPVHCCLAVIVADSAQTRSKFTRDYQKAVRELEKVRAELRDFEERHRPQFMRWLHREFGATLTEMREISSKLSAQQELLFRIQNVAFFEGVSPRKAYEYVMQEQEAVEKEERDAKEGKGEGRQKEKRRKEEGEDHFEEGLPGGEEDHEDFFTPKPKQPKKAEQERESRLKEVYRMVVRKLHPDMKGDLTDHQRDLWHQAQAAYEKGDSEQLEVILAMCEIEEQSSVQHTRLSVLQRITAMFKRSLKPLKAELKKSQKDPAWSFADKTGKEIEEIGRRLQMEMEREVAVLREELFQIETELNEIKTSRKRRSRVVVDPFEIFFRGF